MTYQKNIKKNVKKEKKKKIKKKKKKGGVYTNMDKNKIIKEDFKHSYSSVSKFIRNPSEWLCHYALGLRSPSNAAMTRGNLAEFGAYYKIKRGMQQKDGKDFAKLIRHRFKKLKFLNAEQECDNAILISKKFEQILYERQLRDIKSYQRQEVKKNRGINISSKNVHRL